MKDANANSRMIIAKFMFSNNFKKSVLKKKNIGQKKMKNLFGCMEQESKTFFQIRLLYDSLAVEIIEI